MLPLPFRFSILFPQTKFFCVFFFFLNRALSVNEISFPLTDCLQKGFGCVKFRSINVNVYSWSSASNYAMLPNAAVKLSGKPVVVKHLLLKRRVDFSKISFSVFDEMPQWCSKITLMRLFLFLFCLFKYVYCFGKCRVGIVRCATIEEIEAEKSSIEKDAVSVFVNLSKLRGFVKRKGGIEIVVILLFSPSFFLTESKNGEDNWDSSNQFQFH